MTMFDDLRQALLALPRPLKRAVALTLDIILCALAVRLAFYLRLEVWYGWEYGQLLAAIGSVVIAMPIFVVSGLYRAIFRYGGSSLLKRVGAACLIYAVIYAFIFAVWKIPEVPRSIGIIQPLLVLLLIGASRIATSALLTKPYHRALSKGNFRLVAIYGAGSAGRQLCLALDQSKMEVCAFIDDDPSIHGQTILGKRVYAGDDIENVIESHAPTDILLALPSVGRRRRKEILDRLQPLPVAVRNMPGVTELAEGRVLTRDFHELDIDDLLGRESVEPDERLLAVNIRGKTVVVTGAGGSIGSELCRQVLAREPSNLLLIDNSELALYAIHKELEELVRQTGRVIQIVPLLGSVCDSGRISGILKAWKPHTIYHAAAYKHVPLVEYNPVEGVNNNTFGTLTVAQAAIEHGVSDFVFVSTDKAVRPTNVMGTTKRLAELALQALSAEGGPTRISMVRFGNVLGSSGSVVPLFREQIRNGGPITLTHIDVNRYFMTIPEASQLVIQAGAMAAGGEVFVLDMGEPVRVVDLARRMVELSGLSIQDEAHPEGDIAMEVVGLRPGEKLHEELLIGNDPAPTTHPRIMMAREHFIPWKDLQPRLAALAGAITDSDIAGVLSVLGELVGEYSPEDRVHDLVFRKLAAG